MGRRSSVGICRLFPGMLGLPALAAAVSLNLHFPIPFSPIACISEAWKASQRYERGFRALCWLAFEALCLEIVFTLPFFFSGRCWRNRGLRTPVADFQALFTPYEKFRQFFRVTSEMYAGRCVVLIKTAGTAHSCLSFQP